MIALALLACSTPDSPPDNKPGPYWVKRSDVELKRVIHDACTKAKAANKNVLLAFSAPWCGDCNVVYKLAQQPPLSTELEHWQEVVIDVGRFDRHEDLRTAFKVGGIAHWVALKPECSKPVTEWRRLKSGVFEPDSNPRGLHTPEDLATWLQGARG